MTAPHRSDEPYADRPADGPVQPARPTDPPYAAPPTGTTPPPGTDPSRPAGFDERGKVKRGRISAAWVGLIVAALVLVLLIVFIAQNLDRATVHFLGLSGRAPVGLMLLIAVVGGVLLVAIPGTVRILQLRRALKANTPKDRRTP